MDIDGEWNIPGVGYDYYWAPEATTWYVGRRMHGGTLPSGTYEIRGDWSSLEGCPVNGTWTIEICDSVGVR